MKKIIILTFLLFLSLDANGVDEVRTCSMYIFGQFVYALCNGTYNFESAIEACALNGYQLTYVSSINNTMWQNISAITAHYSDNNKTNTTFSYRLCSMPSNSEPKNDTINYDASFRYVQTAAEQLSRNLSLLVSRTDAFAASNVNYVCKSTTNESAPLSPVLNNTIESFRYLNEILTSIKCTDFDIVAYTIDINLITTEEMHSRLLTLSSLLSQLILTFKNTYNNVNSIARQILSFSYNLIDFIDASNIAEARLSIPRRSFNTTFNTFLLINSTMLSTKSFLLDVNEILKNIIRYNPIQFYFKQIACKIPLTSIFEELHPTYDKFFILNQFNYLIYSSNHIFKMNFVEYRRVSFCNSSNNDSSIDNVLAAVIGNLSGTLESSILRNNTESLANLTQTIVDSMAVLDASKTVLSSNVALTISNTLLILAEYKTYVQFLSNLTRAEIFTINRTSVNTYAPWDNSMQDLYIFSSARWFINDIAVQSTWLNVRSFTFLTDIIRFKMSNTTAQRLTMTINNLIWSLKQLTYSTRNATCALEYTIASADRMTDEERLNVSDAAQKLVRVSDHYVYKMLDELSRNLTYRLNEVNEFVNLTWSFYSHLDKLDFNDSLSIRDFKLTLRKLVDDLKNATSFIYDGLIFALPTTTTTSSSTSPITTTHVSGSSTITGSSSTNRITTTGHPLTNTTSTITTTFNPSTALIDSTTTVASNTSSASITSVYLAEWQPWANCMFTKRRRNLLTNEVEVKYENVSCHMISTPQEEVKRQLVIEYEEQVNAIAVENSTKTTVDSLQVKYKTEIGFKNAISVVAIVSIVIFFSFFLLIDFTSSISKSLIAGSKKKKVAKQQPKTKMTRVKIIKVKEMKPKAVATNQKVKMKQEEVKKVRFSLK